MLGRVLVQAAELDRLAAVRAAGAVETVGTAPTGIANLTSEKA